MNSTLEDQTNNFSCSLNQFVRELQVKKLEHES